MLATPMVGLRCTMLPRRCVRGRLQIVVQMLRSILQGYLDIVRWLCEKGGAAAVHDGVPGIDVRSNDGWTPLSTLQLPYA